MKNQFKEIAALTLASVVTTTIMVACGQAKQAPAKSSISVNNPNQPQQDGQQGTLSNGQAHQQLAQPRFSVNVTDQKPMIAILQTAAPDQVNALLNNPNAQGPVQETIGLDIHLTNLDGSGLTAAASAPNTDVTSPGAGSVLTLQVTLNNSVDKAPPLTMQSNIAAVLIKDSNLTATFTFTPDHKMSTDVMTVVLDGTVTSAPLSADGKVYAGTISITDANNTKAQIGTFSLPVSQIMSDKDAALITAAAPAASDAKANASKDDQQSASK